jgi:hypothetical protein
MTEELEPAYITIVEGPPPDFAPVDDNWSSSILESPDGSDVSLVEMRAFNGPSLVDRCQAAWQEGRPAYLDYPQSDGFRQHAEILAARWERVPEGHKLFLWVAN